jgi:hypothetical protein
MLIRDRPMTLHQYATLVKALRAAQKSSGVGYKTPAATATATTLEHEVDAATEKALLPWPINVFNAVGPPSA